LNKLFPLLFLTLLTGATMSAQGVEAQFTTEKENYLAGEPVFVTLTVSNKGNNTAWLDFKLPMLPIFLFFVRTSPSKFRKQSRRRSGGVVVLQGVVVAVSERFYRARVSPCDNWSTRNFVCHPERTPFAQARPF